MEFRVTVRVKVVKFFKRSVSEQHLKEGQSDKSAVSLIFDGVSEWLYADTPAIEHELEAVTIE